MLASDIILRIRDTLSDPNGTRWSDARLLRSINAAQRDIAIKANLIKNKGLLDLSANRTLYDLPNDCMFITRVLFNNDVLPLVSHEEMDSIDSNWETVTGDIITHIIYDKNNMGQLKVYPVPTVSIPSNGILTVVANNTNFSSAFGIITAINNPVDIYLDGGLVVYYIAKPTEILLVTDDITINDIWDSAIKYYVCGHLLRDDMDTQNRAFGNEELQLYSIELKSAVGNSSQNYTKSTQHKTDYRRL